MDYSDIQNYMVKRKEVGGFILLIILSLLASVLTSWHLMPVYDLTLHQWFVLNLITLPFTGGTLYLIVTLTNYLIVG